MDTSQMSRAQLYAYEHPTRSPDDCEDLQLTHIESFGAYTIGTTLMLVLDPTIARRYAGRPAWLVSVGLRVAGRWLPTKKWKPYHARMARAAADRAVEGLGDGSKSRPPFMFLAAESLMLLVPVSDEEAAGLPSVPRGGETVGEAARQFIY